jgi:hypothetical protein
MAQVELFLYGKSVQTGSPLADCNVKHQRWTQSIQILSGFEKTAGVSDVFPDKSSVEIALEYDKGTANIEINIHQRLLASIQFTRSKKIVGLKYSFYVQKGSSGRYELASNNYCKVFLHNNLIFEVDIGFVQFIQKWVKSARESKNPQIEKLALYFQNACLIGRNLNCDEDDFSKAIDVTSQLYLKYLASPKK